jgi:broad specificity phosphatase PhoE
MPTTPGDETLPETRILLLRHAETSAPDRLHGAESDIGLGPRGLQQADAVAAWLGTQRPDALVSSAMSRALQTARPIAGVCGLEIDIVPELHERKMGRYSGMSREEAMPMHRETMRRWMAGESDYALEGCESYVAMRTRVLPVFEKIATRGAARTTIIVAHGMVIRILLTSILDDFGPSNLDRIRIENVAVNDLRRDGKGWRAMALNQSVVPALDNFAW